MQKFNNRYEIYCYAHSKTPGEMEAYDKEIWPQDPVIGYMLWLQNVKHAFGIKYGKHGTFGYDYADVMYPKEFEDFLRQRAMNQARNK